MDDNYHTIEAGYSRKNNNSYLVSPFGGVYPAQSLPRTVMQGCRAGMTRIQYRLSAIAGFYVAGSLVALAKVDDEVE